MEHATAINTPVQPSKWKQHLALSLPPSYPNGAVWIHACSVGEVNSIAPLVRRLLSQHQQLHLTVVTKTGMQHAMRLFGETIHISYLPWDLPGRIAKMIDHIRPHLLLLTETEFWPGMLSGCRKRGIPVIGINTRISDRSFPKYKATALLWRHWLKPVELFLAQSAVDAERLEQLGIEKDRIRPVGNLKYAITPPVIDADKIRLAVDPSGVRPIILVASTHHDEEQQILKMWPLWKRIKPDLMLVIVPRHPERFDEVAGAIEATGARFRRWSKLSDGNQQPSGDILLVDAMGVLQQLYTIADMAIIGGTLVPVGGHNPLEAAICGRGVITGPHVQNFREVMRDMQHANAAIVADSPAELESIATRFLQHPDELRQLHAHAAQFIGAQAGVLERVCAAITPWLPETDQP